MIGKLEAVGHHQLFQDGANTDNGDRLPTLTHPPPTAELENKGLKNLMVSSNQGGAWCIQPIVTTLIDRERNVNNLLPVEELDLIVQDNLTPAVGGSTAHQEVSHQLLLDNIPGLTRHTPGVVGIASTVFIGTRAYPGFILGFTQSKLILGTQIRTPSATYGAADRTQSPGSRPGSYAETGNTQSFQG